MQVICSFWVENTITGHTLANKDTPVLLEPMEFPDPVMKLQLNLKLKLIKKKWAKHWEDWRKKTHHLELPQMKSQTNYN